MHAMDNSEQFVESTSQMHPIQNTETTPQKETTNQSGALVTFCAHCQKLYLSTASFTLCMKKFFRTETAGVIRKGKCMKGTLAFRFQTG